MKKKASGTDKTLTVEVLDGIPKYDFQGLWTGRDILLISRHLFREYRRSQRSVRREQPVTVPQPEVSDARPE